MSEVKLNTISEQNFLTALLLNLKPDSIDKSKELIQERIKKLALRM